MVATSKPTCRNSAEPDRVQLTVTANRTSGQPVRRATPSWTEQTIARGAPPRRRQCRLVRRLGCFIANTIRPTLRWLGTIRGKEVLESSNSLSAWPCPVVEWLGTVPRPVHRHNDSERFLRDEHV